jgi:hypothetical protein
MKNDIALKLVYDCMDRQEWFTLLNKTSTKQRELLKACGEGINEISVAINSSISRLMGGER